MIDVTGLKKVFDNDYVALKSVDFSIKKNDLVCLLGPSGCGKSTILNLIAGLINPTEGEITFNGKSVINTDPKDRNIGFVFQNYALYPHMTVIQNIMFPLTVGKNKIGKHEAKKIAEKYMKLTDIENLADKKPGTLSGGQQQRVAITRALVQEPDVLLLDEPLSNLDAKLRVKIREEIRQLVKKVGITTIFVTHDQEEALSISDKIILLNEGIIQQDDNPQTLYLEPNNLFVAEFIGNPNMNIFSVNVSNGVIYNELFSISLLELNLKEEILDGDYILGVRPENIVPVKENGLFEKTVLGVELIGRDCILNFSYKQKIYKSIVNLEKNISEGEMITFKFNLSKVLLFTQEGERVL